MVDNIDNDSGQLAGVTTDNRQKTEAILTDGTNRVTVTNNRLDVNTIVIPGTGTIPSVGSKLRYVDMNASSGGVARGTLITTAAYTTVFSYTGSGLLFSALINIETKNVWYMRILVDGEDIFPSPGLSTSDLINDAVYDLDDAGSPLSPNEGNFGISLEEHDRLVWNCPNSFPIRYSTSVEIKLKIISGASKKFSAGLVILSKET